MINLTKDIIHTRLKKPTTMTLEEFKQTDWYKERPEIIKEAMAIRPPTELYKFKDSGKQCFIYGYDEPESGKVEDVTCIVQKTGKGGAMAAMGWGALDKNGVFGVKLDDLELWSEEE